MRVTAMITVGVDIQNPIDVFSDPDINLLNILAEKYEGRCYFHYYIVKVTKIIRRSECMIQAGSDTIGKMTVIIEIDAIRYEVGDVITRCLVMNKDKSGIVIATGPYCAISMDTQDIFAAIKKNNIITVKVGATKYSPGADKISINAYPFVPGKKPIVYHIADEKADYSMFKEILGEITAEEQLGEETRKKNKKGWDFFHTILYPFKTETKPKGTMMSVKDIATKVTAPGYYIRDPHIYMYEPTIVYTEKYEGDAITKLNTDACILSLLKHYLDGMRIIREHVEIYDEETTKSNTALWAIYNKLKE